MALNGFEVTILVLCGVVILGLMNMFGISRAIAKKIVKKETPNEPE